jgi:hypothetical protein
MYRAESKDLLSLSIQAQPWYPTWLVAHLFDSEEYHRTISLTEELDGESRLGRAGVPEPTRGFH